VRARPGQLEVSRRVIDLHAHVVLEEGFGVAGTHGPELRGEVRIVDGSQ